MMSPDQAIEFTWAAGNLAWALTTLTREVRELAALLIQVMTGPRDRISRPVSPRPRESRPARRNKPSRARRRPELVHIRSV